MGKRNSSGKGIAMLLGVAAGAAAGFWLNTTQGKLWRKKMMEDTKDFRDEMGNMSDAAREKAKEFSSNVGTYAEQAKAKANEYAETVVDKVNKTAKQGEDYVVNKASSLVNETEGTSTSAKDAIKDGIERAKSRLNSLNGEFKNA